MNFKTFVDVYACILFNNTYVYYIKTLRRGLTTANECCYNILFYVTSMEERAATVVVAYFCETRTLAPILF